MDLTAPLRRLDRAQQRRPRLAFVLAVIRKFADDQAGNLAALIAYYAFFSLFPLLLMLVTVLGFVLHGHPDAQRQVLDSALSEFPIIGQQLRVHSLQGNGVGLAVGIGGALWAGLGVTQAAQTAFNRVWAVPMKNRPNFLMSRLRGLGMLGLLGVMNLVSTVISGLATGGATGGAVEKVIGLALSLAINVGLFLGAFRLLTASEVRTRELYPGVLLAALLWSALQALGGYYVGHVVKHASETYGLFALVIGLLSWLYLGAQLTLLAAEVNVVRARRLWPRSLLGDPDEPADRRTLRGLVEIEERSHREHVDVLFDGHAAAGRGDAAGSGGRAPPPA